MTQDNKLSEQNYQTTIKELQERINKIESRSIYDSSNGHFVGVVGIIVAVLTLVFGMYSFGIQNKQFEYSFNQQAEQFKESLREQAKINKMQAEQFMQQEKRQQRQRYTELVNILWSVDDNSKPLTNSKLRTEAVKEFLYTDWISELNLSKALVNARLDSTNLSDLNLQNIDLKGANLSGAKLNRTNLAGADLYGANLSNTDFWRANIVGAHFNSVRLVNVGYLDCEGIKKAIDWGFAYRDKKLACGKSIPPDGVKQLQTLRFIGRNLIP